MANILSRFKQNPSFNYSLGIAATWAGAGSIIVGTQMLKTFGLVPFLLWAIGNILTCIIFGVLANKFEYLRKVFTSKLAVLIIGFMCIFQVWVNMSGVHDSLTVIDPLFATIITYVIAGIFLLLLLKYGMIKNIITDSFGWKIVYLLIIAIAIISIVINGINLPTIGLTEAGISDGIHKFFALLPGAFFYPCFWAMFAYNENNKEGVKKVNMQKCFINGGLLFGLYLCFVFFLGITSFTPELEIAKGILIALVALSSLTSFIYSIYLSFGKKIGFAINLFAIIGWSILVPMGVMSIWTMMADCRLAAVIIAIVIAIGWMIYDKHKTKDKEDGL